MPSAIVRSYDARGAALTANGRQIQRRYPLAKTPEFPARFHDSPAARQNLSKAVGDTATHGARFRQDLAPEIYPLFLANFPLYDLITKVECTGLAYTWTVKQFYTLDPRKPRTIRESGVVPEDLSAYDRYYSNIAVFATKRGATLKAQYAARGAVGGDDPAAMELDDGLLTIANDVQNCIMLRQTHDKAGTWDSPVGQYDVDGFDGLRYYFTIPEYANQVVTPDPAAPFPIGQAIDDAALAIRGRGGNPQAIIAGSGLYRSLRDEVLNNDKIQRVVYFTDDSIEVLPGVHVRAVSTGAGVLPIIEVPQLNSDDVYVVDLSALELPWLGSPTPTVLEQALGGDSTLRQTYIVFLMCGLAIVKPYYLFRIAIPPSPPSSIKDPYGFPLAPSPWPGVGGDASALGSSTPSGTKRPGNGGTA